MVEEDKTNKVISLYGAETWGITKRNRLSLKAIEMDYMSRSCG